MSQLLQAFIKHEAGLRRHLSRYITRNQDIEDLLQETYLKALAAEANYTIRAPKSYLFRVAKNLALNELTRKSNTSTEYIEDSASPDVLYDTDGINMDEVVAAKQQLGALARAISTLPPQCRRVLIMRRVEGLSFKEISQQLSISVSTAEKHSAKGLLKCAEFMQKLGHDPLAFKQKLRRTRNKDGTEGSVVAITGKQK